MHIANLLGRIVNLPGMITIVEHIISDGPRHCCCPINRCNGLCVLCGNNRGVLRTGNRIIGCGSCGGGGIFVGGHQLDELWPLVCIMSKHIVTKRCGQNNDNTLVINCGWDGDYDTQQTLFGCAEPARVTCTTILDLALRCALHLKIRAKH